jgi:hypothetical protein
MSTRRRVWGVLLPSLLVVVGLAACSPSAPVPTATSASPTPTPTSTPTPTNPDAPVVTPFTGLAVGDCVTDPAGSTQPEIGSLHVVPCTVAHASEVYALPSLTDGAYPGDEQVSSEASDMCGDAFTGYIGISYLSSDLNYGFYPPDQTGWNSGLRQVTCVVFSAQGQLVASVKGIGSGAPPLAG